MEGTRLPPTSARGRPAHPALGPALCWGRALLPTERDGPGAGAPWSAPSLGRQGERNDPDPRPRHSPHLGNGGRPDGGREHVGKKKPKTQPAWMKSVSLPFFRVPGRSRDSWGDRGPSGLLFAFSNAPFHLSSHPHSLPGSNLPLPVAGGRPGATLAGASVGVAQRLPQANFERFCVCLLC